MKQRYELEQHLKLVTKITNIALMFHSYLDPHPISSDSTVSTRELSRMVAAIPVATPLELQLSENANKSEEALMMCTPELARKALIELTGGYKSRSDYIPASKTNNTGCLLSQKKPAGKRGYIKVCPWQFDPEAVEEEFSQVTFAAHRLTIRAWGSDEQQQMLFDHGNIDESHLCHNINCYADGHVRMESRGENHNRRKCQEKKQCCCGQTPGWGD